MKKLLIAVIVLAHLLDVKKGKMIHSYHLEVEMQGLLENGKYQVTPMMKRA